MAAGLRVPGPAGSRTSAATAREAIVAKTPERASTTRGAPVTSGGAGAKRGTDAERDTGAERGTVAESGADAEKEPKFRRVLTGFTELRRYLAPTVRKRTLAFIREVWSLLHFDLDVDVEYGFDDPGYTGMLYAAHLSVGRILGLEGLCLWPNFTAEMLEISGKLGLRFVPLSLVWSLARFALSKTIRPLWWKNRRIRLFGAKRGA